MSRWWPERLRIGLAPDRVDLARLRLGPSRQPVREFGVVCTPKTGEPPWRAALDAMDQSLLQFGRLGGTAAVVLSNHLVRYAVLPWQPELTRSSEIEQLARVRFEQTYGPAAAAWTIRTRDCGWGQAHVACAVDSALVGDLLQRLAAHRLRLASLQPLLMAAYNDQRRALGGSSAFVIVESGRVCLSLLNQQRWHDIACRRAGADAAEVVEQELATLDSEAAELPLDVLLVGPDAAWSDPVQRPLRQLGRADVRARRSLAMCGAG